jgi:hypothetical protein
LITLPVAVADAITIAEIYRMRWRIETAFQKLTCYLNSEIDTLGYPQAALFGFCLALVVFNLSAVIMAALRATHPARDINRTISEYSMAGEIAATMTGMNLFVPEYEWEPFAHATPDQFCMALLWLASRIDLRIFSKTMRGPKKPSTPRTKFKGKPHVSTEKLLAAVMADRK